MPTQPSVYPTHPKESRVLVRFSENDFGFYDKLMVYSSSLFVVGSLVWVPTAMVWCYLKWRRPGKDIMDNRRKKICWGFLMAFLGLVLWGGPHHNPKVGKFIRLRSWSLWKAWLKFVAFEAILDNKLKTDITSILKEKNILAFCPHGIFPFAFGLGALPEAVQDAFGIFRPVVATAVKLFPVVSTFVSLLGAVDASRRSVGQVMADGDERVGLVPGGIAEIFETYPKRGTHPDEEYTIVRKGFLKMAIQNGREVVPIYCFGSTKMFRRLQLPLLEYLSNLLRISICLFYGVWGLPLPFRQKLTYIVGDPIRPPPLTGHVDLDARVNQMHHQFSSSLHNMFERHKHAYGWGHKSLKIISR
ncbi:hypothetical protein ACA910_004152 [Epithemia clementina (nom. ined.)]